MSVISDGYFEKIQNKVSKYHDVAVFGEIKRPAYDQMKNRSALLFSLEVVISVHRAKYGTYFSPLRGKDALTHLLLQKYNWPLSEIRSLSLNDIVLLLQEDMRPDNLPQAAIDILRSYGTLTAKDVFPELKDDEWDPELYLSIPKQQNW